MGGGRFYVYEHWRLDRDECFYVGKGSGRRAYNMVHRNAHHKAIQSKLNRIGFAIEIRIVACGLNEQEAFALECERIKFWNELGSDLANRTYGGEGVRYQKSADHKAKLAEATRNMSKEQRDKIAEDQRNMSHEQRQRRAEKARMQHANMTAEQKAAKSEKGRINAMKRWNKSSNTEVQ
jgi:hypothetical protein